jgi:nucleoside-diphosphate-sugar epimerase
MHVLVVGATGQIGTALVDALAAPEGALPADLTVTAMVRRRPEDAAPGRRTVTYFEADPFTEEHFLRALASATHVVYGVGLPEQFTYDPAVFERVNVGVLRTFLGALRRQVQTAGAAPRLAYVSTYEVFEARNGVIRETHPAARPESFASPYFRAMARAFRRCRDEADLLGVSLTTIHPAAVYGGRDTGNGLTHYLLNLLGRRYAALPAIVPTAFPVVHADSLAEAILHTLDRPGAFLVSDAMTSLNALARTLRTLAPSYVPPMVPAPVVRPAIRVMEAAFRAAHRAGLVEAPPPMSQAQLDFLTSGAEPKSDRLIRDTPWRPMPLEAGLRRFLDRERGPAAPTVDGGAHGA